MMENRMITSLVLACLVIAVNGYFFHATNDQMFIVLMTANETETSTLVLHDMYCLDPVVPAAEEECNYRVLAPVDGYFTHTNIIGMSIDFEHPSHGTNCRINWKLDTEDVELTCENHLSWYYQLPAFRAVTSTSGAVTVETVDRHTCRNEVSGAWYYKFGSESWLEQRPTVLFIFEEGNCLPFGFFLKSGGGFIIGRRDRRWTTLNNCVYDKRRRCRPVISN